MRPGLPFLALALVSACSFPTGEFSVRPPGTDAAGIDAPSDVTVGPDVPAADAPDDVQTVDVAPDVTPDVPASDVADAPADTATDTVTDAATDAPADSAVGGTCGASSDCDGMSATPVCDVARGVCVACTSAQDVCPRGTYCNANRCDTGCRTNDDCAGSASAGMRCDTATHRCIGCASDDSCAPGSVCDRGSCVAGCTTSHPCGAGLTCCGSMCIDTQSSSDNCGMCGGACVTGTTCCGGACVNAQSDVRNCGVCGNGCVTPNTSAMCRAGSCSIASCNAGFGDCDSDPSNGCEITLAEDVANCGMCGQRCPAGTNSTALCSAGVCRQVCAAGFADCDMNPGNGCEANTASATTSCGGCGMVCPTGPNSVSTCSRGVCGLRCNTGFGDCDGIATNGCETNLNNTLANCGECGFACAAPNAINSCALGRCMIAGCNGRFGDCDANASNGCETDLFSSAAHCGTCARACAASSACASGACVACTGTTCSGVCVDTRTDVSNCGACGRACPRVTNGTATCVGGVCGVGACSAGFGNCDGDATNGCETELATSAIHCGACGERCGTANASPTCAASVCTVRCNAGFANCDGDNGNGCEINTNTDTTSCGTCGRTCTLAHATAGCAAGVCTVSRCETGFGDCDGIATNGCETNLNISDAHCGGCGRACTLRSVCSGGICGLLCRTPYSACLGNCVDTRSDAGNCGACGRTCARGLACSAGACVVPPPTNDRCIDATAINLEAGSRITLAASTTGAAHDLNAPCFGSGGADVFYRFTLTRREIVYADTLGATWDTKLFFASSCTAPITVATTPGDLLCDDNGGAACTTGSPGSQVFGVFNPGTYYLVLTVQSGAAGSTTLRFEHLPVGSGPLFNLPPGTTTRSSSTSGTGSFSGFTCGGSGPENALWWVTCPEQMAGTLTATTCLRASWNTVLTVLNGSGVGNACNNDSGNAFCPQASILSAPLNSGAGLHSLYVDGFGGASGTYSINITRP